MRFNFLVLRLSLSHDIHTRTYDRLDGGILWSRSIKYLVDPRNTGFKFGRRPLGLVVCVCGHSSTLRAKTDKENIYSYSIPLSRHPPDLLPPLSSL